MKATKANNYGHGFWFEFHDGYHGWCLSMSTQEKRVEEKKHGKLIKWVAA